MPTPEQMIEDILNDNGTYGGIRLSQWEQEFLEQIENQIAEDWELSDKQHEKLEEIWNRI